MSGERIKELEVPTHQIMYIMSGERIKELNLERKLNCNTTRI